MGDATFVKHEACERCGSKDNVGVWSDGGKYCFGCGWNISAYRGMSIKDLRQQLEQEEKQTEKNKKYAGLRLPDDFSYSVPAAPLAWLQKYNLTKKEIHEHHFGFCPSKHSLVFPVFDGFGNLLMYQARYFGEEDRPKYDTRGNVDDVYHILTGPANNSTLVVTEDLISSIKVSRVLTSMPLFGSQIAIRRIRTLSDRFSRLVIWLDKDKASSASRACFRALPYFDDVHVVVTDRDPKEYNNGEIESYLGEYTR